MSPDDRKMVEELRRRGDAVSVRAADRFESYHRMDREAGSHVEVVIAMRTGFTGEPPYVGWKGLGLALNEALDERDAALERVGVLEGALRPFAKAGELFRPRGPDGFDMAIYRPAAGDEYNLCGDDLRRARAALSAGTDAGQS